MARKGLGKGLDSLIPDIYNQDFDSNSSQSLDDMLKSRDSVGNEESPVVEEEITEDESEDNNVQADDDEISEDSSDDVPDDETDNNKFSAEVIDDFVEEVTGEDVPEVVKQSAAEEVPKKAIQNPVEEVVSGENNPEVVESPVEEVASEDVPEKVAESSSDKMPEVVEDSVEDVVETPEKVVETSVEDVVEVVETPEKVVETSVDDASPSVDESVPKAYESPTKKILEEIKNEKKEFNYNPSHVEEVKKIVDKNPRITLWSSKSSAVFRYLRKTEPEFSISKEASRLIEDAVSKKYPEIWALFADEE